MSTVATTIMFVISILATVVPVDTLLADEPDPLRTPEQIIESYVQDFQSDRFAAEPMLFGIKVPEAGEWHVRVEPGERVRDDPREMAMPFPMLVVGVDGTAEGEVDGKRVSLPAGNTIFVPAKVNHRWWNETNKPAEAVLIMFGEGA